MFSFRALAPVLAIVAMQTACSKDEVNLNPPPQSKFLCADAAGIGPVQEFLSDPNAKVICDNDLCFQPPSNQECLYGCGQAQWDAGWFSPCRPAPTPSPTPSPTP